MKTARWIISVFIGAALHALPAAGQFDPLAPTPIIEHYITDLGHYFVTSPAEAALIDAGSAGPGWERTGRYFTVEPLAYRLYNKGWARGIESNHRFIVDPNEVAAMVAAGWLFEGVGFCALDGHPSQ